MKTKLTSLILLCILINATNICKAQYVDDFEGANNGWTIVSKGMGIPPSLWELGMPNFGATTGTHSGTHAWDIDLNSGYQNGTIAILYSPVFDFSSAVNATLSFWRNNNCETNWDGTRLEYTIDSGTTWNLLGSIGSGINWYTNSIISSNLQAWDGNSNGWILSSIVLSMLNNQSTPVQFRFVFTSDLSVTTDGFSIDDFSIDQVPQPIPGPSFTFNANPQMTSYPCYGPSNCTISIYGVGTNFATGDTLSINVNFGDGTDSTYITTVNNGYYNLYYATHFYSNAGVFSLQYIINGPNGFVDTVTQYNQLTYTGCGNIEGQLYYDGNNNCIFDSTDIPLSGISIAIQQNGNFYTVAFTDSLGMYHVVVPDSFLYTVSILSMSPISNLNLACPVSGSYTITSLPASNIDFAFNCNNLFDLFGSINTSGSAPGFNVHVDIWYGNHLCLPTSGTVKFVLLAGVTYVSGVPGAIISGDTVIWGFNNLAFNIWSGSGNVFQMVYVHLDSTLQIGDTLCYQLMVDPISGDQDSTNNYILHCSPITGSFDPNEKTVEPVGITTAGLVPPKTTFNYTVNFQNTGTDVAHFIRIVDTLDADLDPATLQILNSSHPMSIDYLPGNILHFNFYNIMLPDSNANEPMSHGSLQYTIAARTNLLQGTQLTNTAYIYFDFNPAVVTNTTLNTIDYTLTVSENDFSNSFVIYPQPASDFFNLKFDKPMKGELKIFDAKGKLCKQLNVIGNSTVSTKELAGGVYYVTLRTGDAMLNNKLVIIK
ncbi:MAG: T9SS type A sorting domain-containing protein [Bacteroidia bacterium]